MSEIAQSKKEYQKQYQKEYNARPEVKEKKKEYLKKYHEEYYARPEIKEKRKQYHEEYQKEYRAHPEVKEKHKQYGKEYRVRPGIKEKRKEYFKEYFARPEVKEKRKQYQKQYQKEYGRKRLQENPQYVIRCRISSRIHYALRQNGVAKNNPALELLGCTIPQLKEYLESKFQPGMTWENQAINGWHIDHIKPCSLFDLTKEEEQKKCFHYTNCQPLWAKDNISKKDSYNEEEQSNG